jgi:hypothetical protein
MLARADLHLRQLRASGGGPGSCDVRIWPDYRRAVGRRNQNAVCGRSLLRVFARRTQASLVPALLRMERSAGVRGAQRSEKDAVSHERNAQRANEEVLE